VAVILSDLPRNLNPKGAYIHPSWADSPTWPAFRKVLERWTGSENAEAISREIRDGNIPCMILDNPSRLDQLKDLLSQAKTHCAGVLILLPCDLVEESDEQAEHGVGDSFEQPDLSNNGDG
jgi:hypothetical protein